jgi:hypothetical protein
LTSARPMPRLAPVIKTVFCSMFIHSPFGSAMPEVKLLRKEKEQERFHS